MKKNIALIIIFLGFSIVLQAQVKTRLQGDKAYQQKDYIQAIKAYNKVLIVDKLNPKQLLKLSHSYYNTKDYENAAKKYTAYIQEGETLTLFEYNQYLQALKLSKYSETDIGAVINNKTTPLPRAIISKYKLSKKENTTVGKQSKNAALYEIKNLNINSPNSDFGVTIFPDSTIMYSSSVENKAYNNIYKKIEQPFINIYTSQLKNENTVDSLNLEKYIEKSMMHSSSPFYDPLFQRFFYTQSETRDNELFFNKNNSNFRIVYGFLDENKKIKKKNYYPENTKGFSFGHPFFDKETNRLYFVSDKPGGFGGTDIYYTEMNGIGILSEPINLGNKINSFANEMFPSITAGNLYFSSDIFTGKGGLDVYYSQMNNNDFSTPTHLEGLINSSADDFAYQEIDNNKGYFSSNRKGGKGSDDIYSFTVHHNLKIIGFTAKERDSSRIPRTKIQISTLQNKIIDSVLTDDTGSYEVIVPMNQDYLFKASKKGYASVVDSLLLSNPPRYVAISKDFYLKEELKRDSIINIEPIFFDFDDSKITSMAKKQLKPVFNYLKKYPKVKFKIKAHTDSRGNEDYNLKLSERRAESIYTYLRSQEIEDDRILSRKGYGEDALTNECNGTVTCSEQKHKENRRIEFVIEEDTTE